MHFVAYIHANISSCSLVIEMRNDLDSMWSLLTNNPRVFGGMGCCLLASAKIWRGRFQTNVLPKVCREINSAFLLNICWMVPLKSRNYHIVRTKCDAEIPERSNWAAVIHPHLPLRLESCWLVSSLEEFAVWLASFFHWFGYISFIQLQRGMFEEVHAARFELC